MTNKAIQDYYTDDVAVCYGCGKNNLHGLHVKTYWDGREGICHFKPEPYHTAFPGFIYGGLIASIIDCHSTGTATAAAYQAENRTPGSAPPIRFVTGTLTVRYLRPTPVDTELVIRARIETLREKKIVVKSVLYAGEAECAQGEVVAIRAPEGMLKPYASNPLARQP